MNRGSTGERLWRALALLLLIILLWQFGNAALSGPAKPVATADDIEAPRLRVASATAAPAPTLTKPTSAPPSPSMTPAVRRVLHVANTGGVGAYLRAAPRSGERLRAWPDNTEMIATGEEIESDGRRWLRVRAPDGVLGWMPADYLAAR